MPSMIRLAAATAVLAIAATLAPATAEAQTMSACYTNKNGTMYRVGTPNTPANCTSNSHVKETWNVQGPQGPQGVKGANGVSGYEIIAKPIVQAPTPFSPSFYEISCPVGKVPLAGSYHQVDWSQNEQKVFVPTSAPSPLGPNTWRFIVRNLETYNIAMVLHVTCVLAN